MDLDRLPLLLHSMAFFRGFYERLMDAVGVESVCEIGIEGAATTRALVAWCRARGARYAGIDPSVGDAVAALVAEAGGTLHRALSLEVLPQSDPCDAYFVDGDHNHYTVRRELEAIHAARQADARPLVIFLHDVGWPWARRDLYYDPASVPPEGRRPHSFDGGLRPGSRRIRRGGFRGLGAYAAALEEGGDGNGVLTAVEDFLAAHPGTYRFARVPAVFGFGLIARTATLGERGEAALDAFAAGLEWFEPLIATLERNRLDLFVRVVDQQDELTAASLQRYELEQAREELSRLAERHQALTSGWRGLAPGPLLALRHAAREAALWALRLAQRRRHLWKARRGLAGVVSSLDQVPALVGDAKVVSFDIFDTLLRRNIEPPHLVHRRSAHFASDLLAAHGLAIDAEVFLAHRRAAEGSLRQRALTEGVDHECTIDAILHAALAPFLPGSSRHAVVDRIVAYELACEAQHLRAAPGAAAALKLLAERGVRLLAISDMYLRRDHLAELLRGAGLLEWLEGHVYVSSEPRLGKYSGRLFELVLGAEGIGPADLLHVGDNIVSDVRAPIAKGIRAILLRDPADEARRRRYEAATREVATVRDVERTFAAAARVHGHAPRRAPAGAASGSAAPRATDRALYEIGFRHIGPAFAVFTLQAMAATLREEIDRVFFLSRDGFILQRAWEIVRRDVSRFRHAALPPAEYLYVSRVATSLAAVDTFGDREVTLGYWRDRPRGLVSVLSSAGLAFDDFRDLVARHGISDPERNLERPLESAEYRALFADEEFRARVATRRDTARGLLRDYLSPAGYFGLERRHALVDIGWNGTIQANLARAFATDADAPHLVGLYFGRHHCPWYAYDDPRTSYLPGLFHDHARRDPDAGAVDLFIPFLEMCACGPHGSVARYERDAAGRVQPLLKPYEHPRELELVQAGILDAAESFARDYDHHELPLPLLHAWAARRLAAFLRAPTRSQVRAIAALQHDLGWGTGDSLRLVAEGISPLSLLAPRRTMRAIRDAAWREGSLRLTGFPRLVEWAGRAKERLRR